MEVRTEVLANALLEGEVQRLCALCLELDPAELDVSYGWACDLDVDLLWKAQRISTAALASFVNRNTASGIFSQGAPICTSTAFTSRSNSRCVTRPTSTSRAQMPRSSRG